MNSTSSTLMPNSNFSFVLPFNQVGEIIYAAIIAPLCLIGVIGNIITITTVLTSSNLKATWYHLITSLAVSDLLSACISPLTLYSYTWGFETWYLPDIFCKITRSVNISTTYVTTLHILWFAMLRLVSLQWPHQFKTFAEAYGKKSIIIIWLVAAGAGFVPSMLRTQANDRDRSLPIIYSMWADCGAAQDRILFTLWYTRIVYPIFIYIPFVLILCLSFAIGVKVHMLRRKRNALQGGFREIEVKKRQIENQIVFQLGLIVGSFLFGYFPTTAFFFFIFGASFTTDQNYWNLTWRFAVIAHVLLRVSECLNPIFYNLSSTEMRRETMAMLKAFGRKISCSCEENGNDAAADEAPRTVKTRV